MTTRFDVTESHPTHYHQILKEAISMNQSDPLYGRFKDDGPRLEAIRVRDRRRLWLGIASCPSMTFVFLFSDRPADIAAGLSAVVQALMG